MELINGTMGEDSKRRSTSAVKSCSHSYWKRRVRRKDEANSINAELVSRLGSALVQRIGLHVLLHCGLLLMPQRV